MIENNPFHISNNRSQLSQNISSLSKQNDQIIVNELKDNGKSSFWDWFRGLVNPLQNLPIISGIYSSINADDDKSDRDLVQNSLGGFLYGGPIGAIAGFGNWVFNKIFDKTPTEMAFDVTGISDLWKDEEESNKLADEKSYQNNDLIEPKSLAKNNVGEWWKGKDSNSSTPIKKLERNISELKTAQGDADIISNNENTLSSIAARYDSKKSVVLSETNKKNSVFREDKKIISGLSPRNNEEKKIINNNLSYLDAKKNQSQTEYRKLNFDYPTWKPSKIGSSYEKKEQLNNVTTRNKYLELNPQLKGSNFNLNL